MIVSPLSYDRALYSRSLSYLPIKEIEVSVNIYHCLVFLQGLTLQA